MQRTSSWAESVSEQREKEDVFYLIVDKLSCFILFESPVKEELDLVLALTEGFEGLSIVAGRDGFLFFLCT